MISDDERREVAKRLRNGGIARNSEEAYVLLLSRIGIRPQLPATNTYEDAMVRLADLIGRPTCRMELDHRGYDYEYWRCSHCGEVYETPDSGGYCPFAFCPDCGAEVVDDEQ